MILPTPLLDLLKLVFDYAFRDIKKTRKIFRPKIGAISSLTQDTFLSDEELYATYLQEKSEDEYTAYILYKGDRYCLNVILRYLRGSVPKIVQNGAEIIDEIDEEALVNEVNGPQDWWDRFVRMYPSEASAVIKYLRKCEQAYKTSR